MNRAIVALAVLGALTGAGATGQTARRPADRQVPAPDSPARRQVAAAPPARSPADRQAPASESPAERQTPASEGRADRQAPASPSPARRRPPAPRSPVEQQFLAIQPTPRPAASRSAPAVVYYVWVSTGTAWRAGTNARIHIEITGSAATGILRLDTPRRDDFERGDVRRYETPPLRLGQPLSFSLTSDGRGFGADWLVEYVCIGTDPDPNVSCRNADRAWVNQWIRGRAAILMTDLPRRR